MDQALRTFEYTGLDRYKKRVKGELKAKSLFEAKAELKGKKIQQPVIREVRPLKKSKKNAESKSALDIQITFGPFGKVSNKELLIFTKKLSTMTRSGLPILDSLIMIQGQIQNGVFKAAVGDVVTSINAGSPFSTAIRKYPKIFDQIYCNLVEAGELTGRLDSFLDRIVYGLERMESIRSGIKSALFYPVTLIVVTLLIVYFMLTKVVPTFVEMYGNMGAKLPGPTQMIVDASDWILDGTHVLFVLVVFFGVVTINKSMLKYVYPYKKLVDTLLLKLPLFGPIITKSTVARMSLLMANLFAAGIGISEILRVAASTSTNSLFVEAQGRIAERIVTGVELSVLFADEPVFPAELSQLIKVGERTGGMEEMLSSIAKYYQEEFEAVVKGLTTVIEPLMIVFVGLMVGTLVVALYLPIFSAGDAIKGAG